MLIPQLVEAIAAHVHRPDFCGTTRAQAVDLALPKDDSLRRALRHELAANWPQQPVRLGASAVRVLHGQGPDGALPDWTAQRVALFAHWSASGSVSPAVRYTLSALADAGYNVVFASGCPVQLDAALAGQCAVVLHRTVTGYDFTSWKVAFAVMPSLWRAQEVLFVNDSVLGPAGSLSAVHSAMDRVACDFWGLVESREKRHHLQSYYLVFRSAALCHPALAAFMDAVDCSDNKLATVLRYEVALAPWLALHGLRAGAYVPAASLPGGNFNPAHYLWRPLLERFDMPFIKRDLLRDHANHPHLAGWQDCLAKKGYDVKAGAAAPAPRSGGMMPPEPPHKG